MTAIRSTLVLSSRRSIAERGLLDAYTELLAPDLRAAIFSITAGTWLDIELAHAHYQAIDALPLSVADHVAIGAEVGGRVQGTMVGTMLRLAATSGLLSPWTSVAQYVRIWDRLFRGGDVLVEKLGPHAALITLYRLPLARIPYFRAALRGLQQTGLSAIWRWQKCYVTDVELTNTSFSYRVAWV